jgi:hypothetical protein
MPLFRCNNCKPARTFEGDRAVCAACDLDPKKDVRHGRFFDELLVIHYDPPTGKHGIGQNVAACNPKKKPGTQGVGPRSERFTGEKAAVTCPKCMATAVFTGETPAAMPLELPIGSLEAAKVREGVS